MQVHIERVELVEMRHDGVVAELGADERGPGVRRVHVQPHAGRHLVCDVDDAGEVVDGACARRAETHGQVDGF